MSCPVFMDVHVPLPITVGLRRRGIDVLTSQDDGAAELADEDLLTRAAELRRVLFTQDAGVLLMRRASRPSGRRRPSFHQRAPQLAERRSVSRHSRSIIICE